MEVHDFRLLLFGDGAKVFEFKSKFTSCFEKIYCNLQNHHIAINYYLRHKNQLLMDANERREEEKTRKTKITIATNQIGEVGSRKSTKYHTTNDGPTTVKTLQSDI